MPKFGGISLTSEQYQNALLIQRVGKSMGMGTREIAIAIATAMQESSLRNLKGGDRDSAGLFQQRPSQGWGSLSQVTDPEYAAQKFFSALKGVKNRDSMTLSQAAQAVQRSGNPDAYARWETLGNAIAGGEGGGLTTVPTTPHLNMQDLAQSYGFAYSFLNHDPSLKKLFNDAVAGSWTSDKFAAELKNSAWYKTNGEAVRQWQYLQSNDPATARQRKAQMVAQLRDKADQLGAVVNSATLDKLATNALMFNWNDSQLNDNLSGYVKAVNGVFSGAAGTSADTLKQIAWKNGVHIGTATLQGWAQAITRGDQSLDWYQQHIRSMAASLAPAYKDQLDAGMDLFDIANPYIQAKAKILEMNPADIDLFDKDVRGALSAKGADGKPASKPLWQFENDLRQNPLWLKTQGAQDDVMATGHKVLQDMGFAT